MIGNQILAQALAEQSIQFCFGIVGVPVIELGAQLQTFGIKYYGYRNEQGASYSAGAVGYLTGRPGICLCVSGPGMIHGMAGVANAWSNNWPMILIAGASDINQDGKNSFQECDQLSLAQPYCKYSVRIGDAERIPFFVEQAVRISLSGRPGPVYLELPGDVLRTVVDQKLIKWPPKFVEVPQSIALPDNVEQAMQLIKNAQNPLVIFGKGAGYSRSEKEIRQFIDRTKLPFLPTTLGKGILSDTHPLCVGPARSTALSKADVILLIGARLNWILHYGAPPRFAEKVKIIQIDIQAEEFDSNLQGTVNLWGDCTLVMRQFNQILRTKSWSFNSQSAWMELLMKKVRENREVSKKLMDEISLPLQYYSSLKIIKECMPKNFFYVGEGANTMDIGRTVIDQLEPRTKLDAGSFGTMGIGIPFCIAAKVCRPEKHVVAILGDSAFGFSAMEIETAIRYKIPMTVIILNNNGIFVGVDEISQDPLTTPPVALKPDTRYEKLADAFGGVGLFVRTHQELYAACQKAFSNTDTVYIINVMISPTGMRKPQEHNWLTKEEAKPKL